MQLASRKARLVEFVLSTPTPPSPHPASIPPPFFWVPASLLLRRRLSLSLPDLALAARGSGSINCFPNFQQRIGSALPLISWDARKRRGRVRREREGKDTSKRGGGGWESEHDIPGSGARGGVGSSSRVTTQKPDSSRDVSFSAVLVRSTG